MPSAVHEAGHATIARVLRHRVDAATLRVVHTWHRRGDPEAHRRAAIIAMAGPMAERRYCGLTPDQEAVAWGGPFRVDLRNVFHHLDAAGGLPCAPVRREAERLVRRHWRSIERVATALAARGGLSGDDVDRLIGR
jgi:hypothetical protein